MPAKIKHRDQEIEFRESDESWVCDGLGLSDKSLAKLKKSVDREAKRMRTMKVPAIYFLQHWKSEASMHEVTIVLLRENGRSANCLQKGPRGGDEKVYLDVSSLFPLDQRDALTEYARLRTIANDAEAAAGVAWEAVYEHHLDAAKIRELVARKADEEA